MLLGTSSVTSRYSLAHVRKVLEIAPHFIDMRKENIFVQTACSSHVILSQILLDEKHWQSADPAASIKAALVLHEKQIETVLARKQSLTAMLNAGQSKDQNATTQSKKELEAELEALDEKLHPIGDYEWAVVCKLVMQSGNLLPRNTETQLALEIFINQLRDIHEVLSSEMFKKGRAFLVTDGRHFQQLFLEFLGQLCILRQAETVAAIHQYLYLGQLALQQSQDNKLSEAPIAMTLAPGLFQGLGIFGQIIPRTHISDHNTHAETQEYSFFKRLLIDFMQSPLFQKPFVIDAYTEFAQSTFSASFSAMGSSNPLGQRASEERSSRSLLSKIRGLNLSSSSSSQEDESSSKKEKQSRKSSIPSLPSEEMARTYAPGYGVSHQLISRTPSSPPSGSEEQPSNVGAGRKSGQGQGHR